MFDLKKLKRRWLLVSVTLTLTLISLSFQAAFAQTLFFMAANDYTDPNMKSIVWLDSIKVTATVASNFGNAGNRKVCIYNNPELSTSNVNWSGPDVNTSSDALQGVISGIAALKDKVGPQDVVFFYWSGHGSFEEGKHYLVQKNASSIPRDLLIEAFQKVCHPRLLVVLTDSCGSGDFPSPQIAPSLTPNSRNGVSPLFDELFFHYQGVVDINAAEKGYFATILKIEGIYQSVFTYALIEIFNENENDRLSWRQFADTLDSTTRIVYRKYKSPDEEQASQPIGIWKLPSRASSGGSVYDMPSNPSWSSQAIYRMENGDRIISVNGRKITDEAHFRQTIASSSGTVVLNAIGHRSGKVYYMKTDLLPKGNTTRLGYYITTASNGGVIVQGVVPGSPATYCRHYSPNSTGFTSGNEENDSGNGYLPSNPSWSSQAIYHLENGDRIIAVNGEKIGNEANFRSKIAATTGTVVLTAIDHRTNKIFYMKTTLLPQGYTTRLGYHVGTSPHGGVVVLGTVPGTPSMSCRHYSPN